MTSLSKVLPLIYMLAGRNLRKNSSGSFSEPKGRITVGLRHGPKLSDSFLSTLHQAGAVVVVALSPSHFSKNQ